MEELVVSQKILKEIQKLIQISEDFIKGNSSASEIEQGLFRQLLRIGFVILSQVLKARIEGLQDLKPIGKKGESLVHKGQEGRNYLSIFGLLRVTRPCYWSAELGKIYVADSALELPRSQTSYLLQEILGENASENDYQESVRVLNQLLNLGLSGKQSARNAESLGGWVEDFYRAQTFAPAPAPECFSASFDGKGVPKIKSKSDEAEKPGSSAENPKKRLGKGEKKNVMQIATLSVTSSFIPQIRSAENLLKGLTEIPFRKPKNEPLTVGVPPPKNDNKWHQGIHRRAFLADQQKAVDYGIQNIRDRMTHPENRFVVPIDAGSGLEEKVLQSVQKYKLEAQFEGIILDIIHVSEYVWDAATALWGEKSPEKFPFVQKMLADLLNSETPKVISQLKFTIENPLLSEAKKKQIQKTIQYFENHQHKMDYKKFIDKGYPISSALVESACGHLVKERMEQTGMRWSSVGAQNILDLRAVKQNGHTEKFMKFVIQAQKDKSFHTAA